MKCGSFNWILRSSFQCIQQIFEFLLGPAIYQWTNNLIFEGEKKGWLICQRVFRLLFYGHMLLHCWAPDFYLLKGGKLYFLSPVQGGGKDKWQFRGKGPEDFGPNGRCHTSSYYENPNSHTCGWGREHVSEHSVSNMHGFNVRHTEGKPTKPTWIRERCSVYYRPCNSPLKCNISFLCSSWTGCSSNQLWCLA